MKTLRILLLLAVGAMLAMVVSDYFGTKRAGSANGITEPEEIPQNLDSKANRWTSTQSSANERKVEIHADTVEQIRDTTLLQLRGVELFIYRADSGSYDRIVCDSARFDGETLYSEDEVTVLLGLVRDDPASEKQATRIRSTGVTFESKTGIASTDRYTEYEFESGKGHSVGSFYDSVNRYFRMNSDAYVEQYATTAGQAPLKIQAGELSYYELGQRVELRNGASLERGSQRMEAAEAIVYLEDGIIRRITGTDARGFDQQAERSVRFETPQLEAFYSPQQILEKVVGEGESIMVSESGSSRIRGEGKRIELFYDPVESADDSRLREAHLRNAAALEARPAGTSTADGEVRRIRSEILRLRMDDEAENMEFAETLARGYLDLRPVEPDGSYKTLEAERVKMFYAAENRMEKLQATGDVVLERHLAASQEEPAPEPLRTRSGGLVGEFDSGGEMHLLHQWANFEFEQGERKGRAQDARFDLTANRTKLTNEAEVWDANSRTSGDELTLDEETGNFTAQGRVASTYREALGDQQEGDSLFSASEPVYATAARMISNQESGLIEYHGNARLWQDKDRVEAEHIRIERRQKTLDAEGKVLSVIANDRQQDPESPAANRPATQPVEVRSDRMHYDESTRRVEYRGDVKLRRGLLRVSSNELDAYLAADGEESNLEKAEARGKVEVTEANGGTAKRQGFGERAQLLPADDKVILWGDPAHVRNGRQDTTQGAELTYFLNDDRLLVQGSPKERSYSLRRNRAN